MIREEWKDGAEEENGEEEDDKPEVFTAKGKHISLSCWDYSIELEYLKGPEDLQLAAELGKTLLERNKELETSLRQCQNIIDEQSQEIEYLTKQSTALRKTNDNRIRIYEQLEVSIQELERANQRLALDNATDKKQIKSLCAYRDVLEARCEDLQKALDDARVQQSMQKEKLRRLSTSIDDKVPSEPATPAISSSVVSQASASQTPDEEDENLINELSMTNQELKSQISKDQRKIADLEEEICRRIQDMDMLEEELCQREEQVKSLREKMSSLEEIRSENLCARCLKEVDLKMPNDHQALYDPEEVESLGDNRSFSNEVHHDGKDDNPYRTLADMYESLVKEQAENRKLSMEFSKSSPLNCLSLQDELKQFDFIGLNKQNSADREETTAQEGRKDEEQRLGKNKMFTTTAADFSEAETSSSGFSDETSNKSTQTERNLIPGSFLCSIADGDDCKFSIYDDACPIESRFRKTPEYRTLFREIFAVLKRAAEAKDQGDELPLLNDETPQSEVPQVPPVTPAREDLPVDFEDLQSLPESLNPSEAASETSSVIDSRLDETLKESSADDATGRDASQSSKTGKDIRLTNDILEYISIGVGVKKKTKRKHTNSPARRVKVTDLIEKIEANSPSCPNSPRKTGGGRRRKEWRNYDSSQASSRNQSPAIQPHVLTTLERKETPPNSHNSKTTSSWLYQPFVSTAAQEVAKLKKLEKSYAEVLKHRPAPKSYARVKGVRLLTS